MKKFGLSLEIPSSDEEQAEAKENNEGASQDPEEEEQEYEESEENDSDNRYSDRPEGDREVSHEQSDDPTPSSDHQLEQDLFADDKSSEDQPQPPAGKFKKPAFGFGGKGGLALQIDDEEEPKEKSIEHEEINIEEKGDDGIQVEGCEATGDISYKWIEALKNVQIVEKGIPFNHFYTNYALRAISQEFKLIRKLTETKYHTAQIAKRQKGKDRYGDLGPFKHTQVKLRSKEKAFDTNVDNYINANHIRSAKQRNIFIATQGPLDTTFLNFWRMVWQEKVSIIFMLCPLKEGEKKKCSEYWPTEETSKSMHIENEFEIIFEKQVTSDNE